MLPHKTKAEFVALIEGATILEAIGENNEMVKVARLTDGRILKLFRRRGSVLTARIRKPYCISFKQNAERLISIGIPSVHVEDVFYLPHMQQYAVLYPLLPGSSLRTILQQANNEQRAVWIKRFADFVFGLHNQGIHFRALHMGNVLITDDEQFGLIDVAGIVFYERALKLSERCRNFKHITRYEQDIRLLTEEQGDTFINAYLKAACPNHDTSTKLRAAFEQGCMNPKL